MHTLPGGTKKASLGYSFPNAADRIVVGSTSFTATQIAIALTFRMDTAPARARALIHAYTAPVEPLYCGLGNGTTSISFGYYTAAGAYQTLTWDGDGGIFPGPRVRKIVGLIDTAAGTSTLYADGKRAPVAFRTVSGAINTTTAELCIGNIGSLHNRGSGCTETNVCLWNGSLPTLADIRAYFAGEDPRGFASVPTSYWPLRGNASDYSGTRDGTVTGAVPGAMVVPVSPRILPFPLSAGAATFNPAWARNSNTVLMGGRV